VGLGGGGGGGGLGGCVVKGRGGGGGVMQEKRVGVEAEAVMVVAVVDGSNGDGSSERW